MRGILVVLLFWKTVSSNTFTRREKATLYTCFQASATHLSNGFTIDPELNFEKEAYTFPLNYSLVTLPCNGQPQYQIIRNFTNQEVLFSPLGHLKVIGDGSFGAMYSPSEYCIQRDGLRREIHYCASHCADYPVKNPVSYDKEEELCIPKCCLPGFVYDYNAGEKCVPSEIDWKPTFYDHRSVNTQRCIAEVDQKRQPAYRFVHPNKGWCSEKLVYPRIRLSQPEDSVERTSWRLLENGSIVHKDDGRGPLDWKATWYLSENMSCIDGIKNFSYVKEDFYKEYTGEPGHETLRLCSDGSDEYEGSIPSGNTKSYVYIFAMFASLVPLGLTIIAYWITWNTQNIHGWTVFSHIASLFLLNFFLGAAHVLSLEGMNSGENSTAGCEFVGIMTHFFFLSTFFWLTMVNFDLWSKFRNLRPSGGKSSEMLPFVGYALFACGGPLLIVVTGVILDATYGRHGHESDCDIILPEYGLTRCHLNKRAEGVYLYFIIGLLILLNVGFFISLILILYRYKKSTMRASRRKSTGRADITSSELFLKLFVVMGCSFALEFISWVVESNTEGTENISWLWVTFDFINILVRAIFIFIIFAWKKQTLIEFQKRCPTACWEMIFAPLMPDPDEAANGPSGSGVQMTKISTQG